VAGGLLSLVIAVALIFAYDTRMTEVTLKTWGSWLDRMVAFSLGVLAHRALRALDERGKSFVTWLRGEVGQATSSSTTPKPTS
jgi:hypothetical protein